MRYGPLIASAAALLALAACKGNDSASDAALARDLDAARSSDAIALAPHAGVQTVVSAVELSPRERAVGSSSRSSMLHSVARHTPLRGPSSVRSGATRSAAAPAGSSASTASADEPTDVAAAPAPAPAAPDPAATVVVSQRPQPVDVHYPPSDPSPVNGGDGGIIGAIGAVILRGGIGDGDHCDPRSRGRRGGGILINQRGPILRGHF